jgi:hypothetical protein
MEIWRGYERERENEREREVGSNARYPGRDFPFTIKMSSERSDARVTLHEITEAS